MNTIMSFLTGIIGAIFGMFHWGYELMQPKPRDHALKAEFNPDQNTLSVYHEGFCIDGRASMSLKDSLRHAVLIGKSGIGKSTAAFIPSLLTMHTSGSSLVIHDPSDELRKACAGHLRNAGYAIRVLDFGNPDRSIGFNPLENIRQPNDIDKLASMLVKTSLKQSDPFWDTSAESLICMAVRLAMKFPAQYRNLGNVLNLIKLLGGNPKRVDEWVSQLADDRLFLDYKAFLANDSKVMSGIVATATAALAIFADEKVALTTSQNTLDFKMLREKRIALFIQNKIADQQYFNILNSIWFEQLFASLLDRVPEAGEKSIYILLDEAASGLRMPSLSNAIANFRKYKVGCLLGLQSVEQLRQTYGENDATTIMSNCFLQMYFSEQSHVTAKLLQEMLGKYTYKDDKGNSLTRNLMEANEIRMLGNDKAIIITGSEKPILANLTPYYERLWLKLRANLKPPVLIGVSAFNEMKYLQ